MGTHTGNVITLANSIIGVSVLAMPFCFKQCGIILSILMLMFSNIISRLSCHYLMKSAIMEKRKNFEMLAFRVFGPTGKLTVELCIIGFMLGTCVAFFVIMGDLGPGIISPMLGFQHPAALRPSVLIAVAIFVVLPLGLLKNVDSLSGVCAATVAFYACLVLKVLGEAVEHLITADWVDKVYYWRPYGILQCIPIFSMALSCQTQLFEIFDSLPSTPLDRMNSVVRSATNMVTAFYISVGMFGYIAYCDQTFAGNLMMNFSKTVTSEVIKIGFLLSVAVSFPLVIFPCRASIHSLLFSKGYEHAQTGSAHIPESRFQCITLVIVTLSLVTGLIIPNIELVLGLVGSTIGVIICVIVPAVIFVSLSSRNNNERLLAKLLVFIGLVILVLGTYANLYATEEAISKTDVKPVSSIKESPPIPNTILKNVGIKDETLKDLKNVGELAAALPNLKPNPKFNPDPEKILKEVANKEDLVINAQNVKDIKIEPPVPEEPVVIKKELKIPKLEIPLKDALPVINLPKDNGLPNADVPPKVDAAPVVNNPLQEKVKNELNLDDIPNEIKQESKGEDVEKEKAENNKIVENKKNEIKKEVLIEKIKEHSEAQEKLIAEGEKLMNELKMVIKEENASKDLGIDLKTNIEPTKEVLKMTVKEEKKMELQKPENFVKEDPLVVSMAKGVPLPLAVKGNVEMAVKEKNGLKSENIVVEKVGRDILGGDIKELREKRELEEVLSESSLPINQAAMLIMPDPAKVPVEEELKKSTISPDTELSEGKHSVIEEGHCVKNSSIEKVVEENEIKRLLAPDTIANRTNKDQYNKPDDQLIKFSLHLSDPKPILDVSPQLLDDKAGPVLAEMPKKRDLKSIETDEQNEMNPTNA